MPSSAANSELRKLLELYCENNISQDQAQRLEQLVRQDDKSLELYCNYIDLHGNLIWDTARTPEGESLSVPPVAVSRRTSGGLLVAAIAIACVALLITTAALQTGDDEPNNQDHVATTDSSPEASGTKGDGRPREPVRLDPRPAPVEEPLVADSTGASDQTGEPVVPLEESDLVARINEELQRVWNEAEVEPSERASRSVWVRRTYLDLVGRVPTVSELESSLARDGSHNPATLVGSLLDEPEYARHWSTLWSNLLIGRRDAEGVNRAVFEKFLRDRFAANSAWNETVAELIAAEGSTDDDGATNFLVAHLNNAAVPATAVTASRFLGIQIQCMQCHDHPWNKGWGQEQFWTFNSFFKQTKRRRVARTGQTSEFLLTSMPVGGPTHYETRSGLMRTAYPEYKGATIDPGEDVNRRQELARLITTENNRQLARAMVNRVWAHFFGYGFTTPVDDMGPHNRPVHPELFNLLVDQFVAHEFDVRKLIRWICLCEAYQLESRIGEGNTADNPDIGEVPLFSRMYVRSMSPEQVYDSLITATRANYASRFDWDRADERRHEWIQQFIFAHNTEENDESTTFDGSITQALSLMNGETVQQALSGDSGTLLGHVISRRATYTDRVRELALAAVAREPTDAELSIFRNMLRQHRTTPARNQLLQDVFWAYLNSNEFILIH